MSRISEDRGGELRALFFESANELLQSLNEAGLELESRSADEEIIREIRRIVHTLKGDSAACGFHKLSELAHELEDVLSMQVARASGGKLAETVLAAADSFESMLAAYRRQVEPPSMEQLHAMIRSLLAGPEPSLAKSGEQAQIPARFEWSEYERLMISEALHRGERVFNIALRLIPDSVMRAAAFQLVQNVLHAAGTLIALRPENNATAPTVEIVEAALASSHNEAHLTQRCRIPAIVSAVRVEHVAAIDSLEHDLIGELLEAEAAQVSPGVSKQKEPAKLAPPGGPGSAVATVAESTLRVDAGRIDTVMNLVGELIIGKSMFQRALSEFHSRDPVRIKLADSLAFQSRVLDELHKCVLKIRMVPVEQLFRRFPRVVRDLAKHCSKNVTLEIAGQNTDLDKGILDALAEPLTHLVRNAVDHGIEPAEERLATGKPANGAVYLNAYHQGTQVVIEVRDDGRGIDPERLRVQAVEKGLMKKEEVDHLTESETLNLIFQPGFSTAVQVTELSGRGVGMDIVRTVLDRLKGTVHISSKKGAGTVVQLRAPLTLASIQTLLFRVATRLYAVPLSSVLEITRVHENEVHRVDQREVLRLREQILTLIRLNHLDRIHAVETDPKKAKNFVIVIGAAEKRFGLVVDNLVGEQELVIKALPGEFVSSDLVSGASILGDGTVVLILNVPAVLARLSPSSLQGAIA